MRQVTARVKDRWLARRIFNQIASDQIVEVDIAQDCVCAGKVFFEDIKQTVEIGIGVYSEAVTGRKPSVAGNYRFKPASLKRGFMNARFFDAGG